MSRFDVDTDKIAEEARQLHEQTTKERASYDGGSPPPSKTEGRAPKKEARKATADAEPSDDPMKFHIRANLTFTEDDPIGRVLAERLRAMPEASRKHYSPGKAVRDAIMGDLEALAKQL